VIGAANEGESVFHCYCTLVFFCKESGGYESAKEKTTVNMRKRDGTENVEGERRCEKVSLYESDRMRSDGD
jgi:hypothetical protein